MANAIISGAEAAGSAVETVFLHGEKIAPCDGCDACQRPESKGCHIDDDMQAIYPKLVDADAWVFAGPIYYAAVSAQTKLLLDRFHGLNCYGENPGSGKRIAIALTYGGDDLFHSGGVNAMHMFQDVFAALSSDIVGLVHGSAWSTGEIKVNTALLEKAEALGKRLAGG